MAYTGDLPTNPEDCVQGIVSPDIPCATHNVGVQVIDSLIFRFTQEMTKNQSSRVVAFSEDDKARIDSYYDELRAKINECGDSIMDFHGLVYWRLTDLIGIQLPVENETINASLSYLLNADYNLRVSQSSRLNDGLLVADKKDLVDAVNKSQALINSFYDRANPMDMPQSNPRHPVSIPTSTV